VGALSTVLMALMPTPNTRETNRMMPCTPSIEPAITVTVSDAQTGVPLEATIVVKDGNFQEELKRRGVTATGQMIYGGAFERPGVYSVKTSKEGYEPSVLENIKVTQDQCHVVTRQLSVLLTPTNFR
ncbi:MAG: hypothetical protein AB1861_30600, partial [Cyanobacteriota bacterium]